MPNKNRKTHKKTSSSVKKTSVPKDKTMTEESAHLNQRKAKNNIDPNQKLFNAIYEQNHIHFYEAIIAGANINIITKDGKSALVVACMLDFQEAIRFLTCHVSVKHRNAAIFYAIENEKWNLALSILRVGVDPNAHMTTKKGYLISLLHRLVLIHEEEMALKLIDKLFNYSKKYKFYYTDIYKCPIDIDNPIYKNLSPLALAVINNKSKIAVFLASHGANVYYSPNCDDTILHLAINCDATETCLQLLTIYPDALNLQDSHGRTLLMLAADKNNGELIDALLALGADTTLTDNTGDTAFMHAVSKRDPIIVEKLAAHPGINISNSIGLNPIMVSIYLNDMATFNKLLENGADKNIKTPEGQSLFEFAQSLRRIEITEKLKSIPTVVASTVEQLSYDPPVSSNISSLFSYPLGLLEVATNFVVKQFTSLDFL